MANFTTSDEVLHFAIDLEEQMIMAYTEFSKLDNCSPVFGMLLEFVEEEKIHLQRIHNILGSGQFSLSQENIAHLSKDDYVIRKDCNSLNSCVDILTAIMDNEKMAFKFYSEISGLCEDRLLKLLFDSLAVDESKHKLKFELVLDELNSK